MFSQRLITYGSFYKHNHIGCICEKKQNRLQMMHLHHFVLHLGTQGNLKIKIRQTHMWNWKSENSASGAVPDEKCMHCPVKCCSRIE